MTNAPRAKAGRKRDAAAIVAAEAAAAGLTVKPDPHGRFHIVADAAEIARIPWRAPLLAGQQVEIVVGPIVRRSGKARRIGRSGQPAIPEAPQLTAENGFTPGPKARALLRGIEIAEADLKSADGTFSLDEVVRLLRISRQAIDKKVKDDALLAVPGPGNERRYPACQFRSDGVVAGLRDVLRALPSRNPWFRLNFLVNPEPRLAGKRPCDVLRQGNAAAVVAAAGRVAEMGS